MQEFCKQDFQFLYNACFTEYDRGNDGVARFLRMTDRGVFYDDCLQEGGEVTKSMRWKPVHELAGPNKPSSLGPALPFPFMANELAAFMLWGWWGSQFQSFFGPLNCGPNELVLNGDHEDAADAYEALKQAYVIYSDAQHVVGELDQQDREHALDMLNQFNNACSQAYAHEGVMEREDGSLEFDDDIPRLEYFQRIARAKESVAAQKALLKQANKQADATERTWRTAMVRQLLQTQAVTPSPAPVSVTSVSGGVEPDNAKPLPLGQGLSTKDIAHVFDGVYGWNAERWTKNLSASKWLHSARIAIGEAGGVSSVWSPLMLAQLMHDRKKGEREKEKLMKVFNSRFTRYPALGPWRDAFNEYFTTHCDAD